MSNASKGAIWWIVILAITQALRAQEPSIEAGARIRITAPYLSDRPIEGTFEAVRDTFFVFRRGQATETTELRLSQIKRLEVVQGNRTNVGGGAAIGALIGGLAGAAVGLGIRGAAGDVQEDLPLITGAIGAGGGLLVGTLLGSLKRDRWVEVSPERLRVTLIFHDFHDAQPVGLGISFTW